MKTRISIKKAGNSIILIITGLLLGWLLFGSFSSDPSTGMLQPDKGSVHQYAKLYTCSMHPDVRQHEPGNCPICGMKLIPVKDKSPVGDDPYTLKMTPAAIKLAEVQTTTVHKGKAEQETHLPGKIMIDEHRMAGITAQFPGRIEELYIDFTGQQVRKGQKLASIYSPQLITAQKELLEAGRHKDSNPALYRAARKKLKLWKLPESTIKAIEEGSKIKNTIDIVSPVDGYVLKRNVSRQDYIKTGTQMYSIANLSAVWVVFNAFENQIMGLKKGDKISFTVDAYPGQLFKARLTYINPVLDASSRTISVRAQALNPKGRLKPGMLAEGVISSTLYGGSKQLLVPKSAVLWTGERSVVYVKKADAPEPAFEFRKVVLGPRVGDAYIVKSGLASGERVVTHGNFMIDSAAQLAGKASMMNQDVERGEHTGGKPKARVPKAFIAQLNGLTNMYLEVKQALRSDDVQTARTHIAQFNKKLSALDRSSIKQKEQMQAWMQYRQALIKYARAIQRAGDLASFRKPFALLSGRLKDVLTTFGVTQPLYVQFCPMARNGEGAYWIDDQKAISNPYMGPKMPSCGNTKQTLIPASKS